MAGRSRIFWPSRCYVASLLARHPLLSLVHLHHGANRAVPVLAPRGGLPSRVHIFHFQHTLHQSNCPWHARASCRDQQSTRETADPLCRYVTMQRIVFFLHAKCSPKATVSVQTKRSNRSQTLIRTRPRPSQPTQAHHDPSHPFFAPKSSRVARLVSHTLVFPPNLVRDTLRSSQACMRMFRQSRQDGS